MKNHIDLLIKKKSYKTLETFFDYFKIVTIFLAFVSLTIAIVLILLRSSTNQELSQLNSQKSQYLSDILKKKDIEKQALYFNQKSQLVNNYLKNDVNFLPYYRLLQEYLPLASNSASIQGITYDNKRNVVIILAFNNYNDFYNSLSNLQDKRFLSIFESLSLDSFSITEDIANKYTLILKGKFNQLPT